MVHLLEDCNLCAIHAKRVTISARLREPDPLPMLQSCFMPARNVNHARRKHLN